MLKIGLSLLVFSLALSSCNQEQSTSSSIPAEPDSAPAINYYQQGLELGYQAAVAAQSAADKDAWESVAEQWQKAIESLARVSIDQAAQLKIEEYRENLAYAQSRVESLMTGMDYVFRGGDKYIASDFTGAIQDYNKAIELDPNIARAYFNRGEAWIRLNNNDNAIKDLEKAIQLYQQQNDEGGVYIVTTRLNDLKKYGR